MRQEERVKDSDINDRYQRAQAMEQGWCTKEMAFNDLIYPCWIEGTDIFWYKRDGKTGYQYRLVDAVKASNEIAFDHQALARALSESASKPIDADNLPLDKLEISLSPRSISFDAFEQRWLFDQTSQRCETVESLARDWKVSPDGTKAVFIKDYNLWLQDFETGQEKALTDDGEKFNYYASTTKVYGHQEWPTLEVIWSADSKQVFTQVIDTREVGVGLPLVEHIPADGSLRPRIIQPDRRVGFADDEHIECWQFLAIDVASGEIQRADYRPCPVYYPHYVGYFTSQRGWWGVDSRHAYFTDLERGGKVFRLVEFDTYTGETKVIIEDTSDWFTCPIPAISHVHSMNMYLPATNELIWYSHRSGWAHIYLYDLNTGELKYPITQGNWVVRNILHFDMERRELFIQTAGRVDGRNPYYRDICRVNIDTGELVELIGTDHDYTVCDGHGWLLTEHLGVSSQTNYIVTTRSRVDLAPVTLLLNRDGREVLDIETADISGLPDRWQWPEPVMLKAEDGKTDIYGVVFRPTDFSPEKSYPVIDVSFYFGAPVSSFGNGGGKGWIYCSASAYAELGFIAVVIFGRGNDYLRGKNFNSYKDPELPLNPMFVNNYNKRDCIAGIKQLAEKYPYMDINRVGAVETNTLATALCGMLLHPEFYKVGVTRNSNANWRMMGALGMQGSDQFPVLEDFAGNLKGKLMLVAGMLDSMVPVSMTFRMIAALQKANKTFDMLLLPNDGHMISPYAVRRTWDYLVTHLLGEKPPVDFELSLDALEMHAENERQFFPPREY